MSGTPKSTPRANGPKRGTHGACPECGSTRIIDDATRGEKVCQNCGAVLSEFALRTDAEWRAFSKEERDERERVGAPSSLFIPDKGLSTVIDKSDRDVFGRHLSSATRQEMHKLRRRNMRTQTHSATNQNLIQAMIVLDRITSKLHIPQSIKENSALIYRRALEGGFVKGRLISTMMVAALYAACRLAEVPRTLKDFAKATGMQKKMIARYYQFLVNELELKVPIEDPVKHIAKICSKTRGGISMKTQQRAIDIIKTTRKKGALAGKDPVGLAAAALYVACTIENEKMTQRQIAEAANVTEVTIRNRCKDIKARLAIKE